MTTASPSQNTVQRSHLGTLSVLAWTGDPEEGHDMPYLIAYSLGDGAAGAEAGEAALLAVIDELGLTPGGGLYDATVANNSPIRLLVEGGHAVLNMPYLSVQCRAPQEWLTAAEQRGHAHFMVASRPWPEAVPGRPVTEEMLQAFLGDQDTLTSAAHILLPVSRLRR
ncbi:hypothetical protein FBY35_2624 [Streptomyces sp. SLBN-118]|uniref:DUF5949 family protein n=1 Tax=Streptomyces sp. SLBN-118 TaxID=2768454 RepID=UPI0011543CE3|nr:DUF5949 family protein [Streptomyces sp. SLBN-118]TQK52197.1 hypothetical protein FBY35_2624 [Streptomyces sp. SLBN-118]